MHTASSTYRGNVATSETGIRIWSCVHCRRRKLRCERRQPCSNCVRSNLECHFPVTGRIPRRSRDPEACKSSAEKQSELLGRLRRLEAVVTELTAQMEDGAIPASRNSDFVLPDQQSSSSQSELVQNALASWQQGADPMEDFGSLLTDSNGNMRVSKGFWSIFCHEVRI